MRRFGCVALIVLLVMGSVAAGAYRYVDSEIHDARRVGQPALELTVPAGTGTSGVADILKSKGLIGSTFVFELYVRVFGHANLEAGDYQVPGGYSMAQLVALLEHSRGQQLSLTIPEGYTAKQIGGVLEKLGVFSAGAYLSATQAGGFNDDFLAGRSAQAGLEGYLFPDTYFIDPKATPTQVIQLQLTRFGQKVSPELRAEASQHNITFAQAVVLASIIEREAKFAEDRAMVASVFYNRIRAGMALEADATLLYAQGKTSGEVTEDDKAINSPYNTYLHTGIPPGAISNPGLAAITAALEPASSSYLFYVTDSAGHAHFSRTLADHQRCQQNLSACPFRP